MKKAYVEEMRLSGANMALLESVNSIIEDYRQQGLRLTLRQLYYQLVVHDIIPNKQTEYSKLSTLLTKGRLAGYVDWDAIEDRLRVPSQAPGWDSPQQIVNACAAQYRRDRMEGQESHIEVWVEKDALSAVLRRATTPYGCALMVNRGYSSTTAMHDAYNRFARAILEGRKIHVLYLGDHDPSGLDMVRDIRERIATFAEGDDLVLDEENFQVHRIALTKRQIQTYNPPPNPAKITDPRASAYIEEHGPVSWEVDALPPEVLDSLVRESIERLVDMEQYGRVLEQEKEERELLQDFADNLRR